MSVKKSLFWMAILAIITFFVGNPAEAAKLLSGKQIEIERGDAFERICRNFVAGALVDSYSPYDCLSETQLKNPGRNLNKIRPGDRFVMPHLVSKYLQLAGIEPTPSAPTPGATAPTTAPVAAAPSPAPAVTTAAQVTPPPSGAVVAAPPVDSHGNPVVVQDTRGDREDMAAPATRVGVPTLPRPTAFSVTAPPTITVPVYPDNSPTLKELLQRRQVFEIELTRKLNELARHEADLVANAKVPTGRSPQAYGISFKIFPQDGWEKKWEDFEKEEAVVQGFKKREDILKEIARLRAEITAFNVAIAEFGHKNKKT